MHRAEGFSLVEVLVAFTILSLTMIMGLKAVSQAMDFLGRTERTSQALAAGLNLMQEMAAQKQLSLGLNRGVTRDGLHWQVKIEPQRNAVEPDWTAMRALDVSLWVANNESMTGAVELSSTLVAEAVR